MRTRRKTWSDVFFLRANQVVCDCERVLPGCFISIFRFYFFLFIYERLLPRPVLYFFPRISRRVRRPKKKNEPKKRIRANNWRPWDDAPRRKNNDDGLEERGRKNPVRAQFSKSVNSKSTNPGTFLTTYHL